MATETYGNGHYWRDSAGVWRYTVSGAPVPGARPRQIFDAEHDYPRREIDSVRYVVVPRWRLDTHPELIPVCAREGVLAEQRGLELDLLLVPEPLWPTAPDPAGGMWAPELAPDRLVDAAEAAALMGYAHSDTIWALLRKGVFPAPYLRLNAARGHAAGRPRTASTTFWPRPVLEQWRDRWRELFPRRYDVAAKVASQRRRRAEREARLAALGRVASRPGPPQRRRA